MSLLGDITPHNNKNMYMNNKAKVTLCIKLV